MKRLLGAFVLATGLPLAAGAADFPAERIVAAASGELISGVVGSDDLGVPDSIALADWLRGTGIAASAGAAANPSA